MATANLTCEECGAKIRKAPSYIKPHTFCGNPCYWKWRRKQTGPKCCGWKGGLTEARIKNALRQREERLKRRINTCERCGLQFDRGRKPLKKFCSPACRSEGKAKRKAVNPPRVLKGRAKLKGDSNPMYRHGRAAKRRKRCLYCKAEFMGHDGNTYCSRHCKGKDKGTKLFQGKSGEALRERYREDNSGEGNRNWRGGRSKQNYGSGWTDGLRKSILERDGHLCQICGNGLRLQVHHRDESKTNHAPDNLMTLCQSCHVKVHHGKLICP